MTRRDGLTCGNSHRYMSFRASILEIDICRPNSGFLFPTKIYVYDT